MPVQRVVNFQSSFLATYKHGEVDLELNALGGGDGIGDSAYVLTYKGKSLLLDGSESPKVPRPTRIWIGGWVTSMPL